MIPLKINKHFEVSFHGTVLPFGLAVNLQIKDGGKPMLDVEEVAG